MSFKVKKIRAKKGKLAIWHEFQEAVGAKLARSILFVLPLSVLCLFGVAMLQQGWLTEGPTRIIPKFTVLDETDGHTNILLLGVAGKNEEGGNLSDSIMLASINGDKSTVSLLSLPRDLYLESEVGSRKVNEIYAAARYKHGDERGLEIVESALSRFTGIPIHYAAVVNFDVFEEVVNELDGIKMFVPEDIVDPFYPDVNYGFQTFIIRKGIQNLDGDMALKYARSRKTSSDYSRAKRQQDLLFAIKEKAKEDGVLYNATKLTALYKSFKDNVNTDLGLPQIIALAKVASGVDYEGLVSAVLNDDPIERGGLLYAPAREFYNGQFVLLPQSLKDTQKFIELTLITPEILLENAQIAVLNGSRITGLASQMALRLRQFGFHVIETGNYESSEPVFRSFYETISSNETSKTQEFLKDYLELMPTPPNVGQSDLKAPPSEDSVVDLNVILGVTYDQ